MLWGVSVAKSRQTKYIFVTGGVLSGLGKGIAAASLGNILKARGLDVNLQKCDPYLNTDAGTLNPAEHGEVFVTHDGGETDLDLGHYERFLGQELGRSSSLMNGRILSRVIADERAGKYLGKTVQIIPHVTSEIQKEIMACSRGFDVHIVEIGGTVGDYESLAFLEAIRQLRHRVGAENVAYMHLVYLPYLEASKELKTKPAQNTVRDLREAGIQPDVVIARSERPVPHSILEKISMFTDVDVRGIVALPTASTVYEVPLMLESAGLDEYLVKRLGLPGKKPKLTEWRALVASIKDPIPKHTVRVGVVAKYMSHEDTYMSVFEALKSAGWAHKTRVEIVWIDAEKLETADVAVALAGLDGIVVPGGFGARGVEGKIRAAAYAMRQELPYLGLCLGMQTAVIALAREALGTEDANSTEMNPDTKHPVIHIMEHQKSVTDLGGTMRLGNYPCELVKGSISAKAYGTRRIRERHRHRYEFNNKYRAKLEKAGMVFSGLSPDGALVEIVEMAAHPFFVASQFHPEFKSRPDQPHPLFAAFTEAMIRLQA
jgi:CTP synthase